MKERLFSYGTLQEEQVQFALFGRVLTGSKDYLEGYIIEWIGISDAGFLATGAAAQQRTLVHTGNKEDRINGTVLELTAEELSVADEYEPAHYIRTKVTLRSGKEAWVYISTL